MPTDLASAVRLAREAHDARFHGLLVALGASKAMDALCEPVHRYADWHALLDVADRARA